MGKLQNIRHEAFAQQLVLGMKTGKTQGQCYSAAGYNSVGQTAEVCASQMLKRVKNGIQDRVQELLNHGVRRAQMKAQVTVKTGLDNLEAIRAGAFEAKQFGAATNAEIAKLKLVGLMVDRKEIGAAGEFAGLETAEDVIALVTEELGEQAAALLLAALDADAEIVVEQGHEHLPALAGPPAHGMTFKEYAEWKTGGTS